MRSHQFVENIKLKHEEKPSVRAITYAILNQIFLLPSPPPSSRHRTYTVYVCVCRLFMSRFVIAKTATYVTCSPWPRRRHSTSSGWQTSFPEPKETTPLQHGLTASTWWASQEVKFFSFCFPLPAPLTFQFNFAILGDIIQSKPHHLPRRILCLVIIIYIYIYMYI